MFMYLMYQSMMSNPCDRHELVRYDVKQVRHPASSVSFFLSFFLYDFMNYIRCCELLVMLFQVVCSVCDTEQPVCVFLCNFM
jgi:hypothetical protein